MEHVLHYSIFHKDQGLAVCCIKEKFSDLVFACKALSYEENIGGCIVRKVLEAILVRLGLGLMLGNQFLMGFSRGFGQLEVRFDNLPVRAACFMLPPRLHGGYFISEKLLQDLRTLQGGLFTFKISGLLVMHLF